MWSGPWQFLWFSTHPFPHGPFSRPRTFPTCSPLGGFVPASPSFSYDWFLLISWVLAHRSYPQEVFPTILLNWSTPLTHILSLFYNYMIIINTCDYESNLWLWKEYVSIFSNLNTWKVQKSRKYKPATTWYFTALRKITVKTRMFPSSLFPLYKLNAFIKHFYIQNFCTFFCYLMLFNYDHFPSVIKYC